MSDNYSELAEKADRYLQLCEERRLEEASTFLADDAVLTFPGPARFTSLPEMVADAAQRYREVRKHRTTYVTGNRVADGLPVVISTGTLDGTSLDGHEFEGVRYSDMFVFKDGLIAEQYVFNDLADTGSSPRWVDREHDQANAGGTTWQ